MVRHGGDSKMMMSERLVNFMSPCIRRDAETETCKNNVWETLEQSTNGIPLRVWFDCEDHPTSTSDGDELDEQQSEGQQWSSCDDDLSSAAAARLRHARKYI
jgi:hypothetical protein